MVIKILIADDHRIIYESLKPLIDKEHDMEIVAVAENGRQAVKLSRELKPDVVIMDISMPDLNGIEATHQIVKQHYGVKVIALSMNADRRYVKGMLQAGASGYLTKSCSFEELTNAIRIVSAGKRYLSPGISGIVIDESLAPHSEITSLAPPTLTVRGHEVLQLLAEGMSVQGIADKLFLSIKTVHTHRTHIMEKLNIHSIAELTKYAIREGFTTV